MEVSIGESCFDAIGHLRGCICSGTVLRKVDMDRRDVERGRLDVIPRSAAMTRATRGNVPCVHDGGTKWTISAQEIMFGGKYGGI
jgi:hypothetical protein